MTTKINVNGAAFRPRAYITFADGSEDFAAAEDIGSNTALAFGADSNTLPIGAAVGRSLTLELINDSGQWEGRDWYGATVHMVLSYDDEEIDTEISLPDFTVTEPPKNYGAFVTVTCLDNMHLADKPYETALAYPTTIGAVWREACRNCGLTSGIVSQPIFRQSIETAIPGDYTYRQVFGFIAALAGGNACIDGHDQITIQVWAIPSAATTDEHLAIDRWVSLTPAINDVTITGISAVVDNTEYLAGTAGYVLRITDNPLLTAGNVSEFLENILSVVGGKPFRPYTAETFFDPAVEFGDAIILTDVDGSTYYSVVTSVAWPLGGRTSLRCALDAPYVPATQNSVSTPAQAVIAAKALVAEERTEREQAIVTLQNAIANSSGMYKTEETQPDGSVIYYLHDKPTLAASSNVIKLTSEAIALSTDGGRSYPYGFQITGDLVVRLLSATGISADWIDTGALTVIDDAGHVVFQADVTTGVVYIDGIAVDNGVVTVGMQGEPYYTQVTEDGLKIFAKGQLAATLGVRESRLPQATIVPPNGAITAGFYRIYTIGNTLAIGI